MKWITHIAFTSLLVVIFKINPIAIVFSVIPDFDKFDHRGITHSWLAILISYFYFPAFVGVVSHIFLDMLTYSGVELCWPLKTRFVIFGKIVTGSKEELKITAVILSLLAGYSFLKILNWI